jgi:hypothetical protein
MVADPLFSDYLVDSNNFKNILLTCDRFKALYPDASEVYAKVHFIAEMNAGTLLNICWLSRG